MSFQRISCVGCNIAVALSERIGLINCGARSACDSVSPFWSVFITFPSTSVEYLHLKLLWFETVFRMSSAFSSLTTLQLSAFQHPAIILTLTMLRCSVVDVERSTTYQYGDSLGQYTSHSLYRGDAQCVATDSDYGLSCRCLHSVAKHVQTELCSIAAFVRSTSFPCKFRILVEGDWLWASFVVKIDGYSLCQLSLCLLVWRSVNSESSAVCESVRLVRAQSVFASTIHADSCCLCVLF